MDARKIICYREWKINIECIMPNYVTKGQIIFLLSIVSINKTIIDEDKSVWFFKKKKKNNYKK